MRFVPIASGIGALALLLSCKPLTQASSLHDIYRADDLNPERRHQASILEAVWTVHLKGCSGILLNPELLLTARHCQLEAGQTAKSGLATVSGIGADIEIQKVIEENSELDYALATLKWIQPMASGQTFPAYVATNASDIFASQIRGQGDAVFTVGFPDDKAGVWQGTYAEGQLKGVSDDRLKFNVGIINGNSGGGVVKKENLSLVALALGGSKIYGEKGWEGNDIDTADAWNYGLPLWTIYAASPTLRKAFPGGKNAYFGENFLPRAQIFVRLAANETGVMLQVASNHQTAQLLLCPSGTYPCDRSTSGVKSLSPDGYHGGRRIYTSKLGKGETKQIGFVALDAQGTVLARRQVELLQP